MSDHKHEKQTAKGVSDNCYIRRGKDSRRNLERGIKQLFDRGNIPTNGWSELWINHLLQEISLMDSNNFQDNGSTTVDDNQMILSPLVARNHFYLKHGIGKTGDITSVQPKAAGTSLLSKIANSFAGDVMKMQGVTSASCCLLMPVDIGMTLMMTLLMLKQQRPKAKYVVWSRIDEKS